MTNIILVFIAGLLNATLCGWMIHLYILDREAIYILVAALNFFVMLLTLTFTTLIVRGG